MNKKKNKKNLIISDSTAIKEESNTVRLSSDSIEYEKGNVFKYMGYTEGYFAYLRIGKTSGPIRFYRNLETAYSTTLNECAKMLSQGIKGSRTQFQITDCNNNPIYDGEPKTNGSIQFSIYEGISCSKTYSLNELLNITPKVQNNMKEIAEIAETSEIPTTSNTDIVLDNDNYAESINFNARIFIENNILTQDNVNFLSLSKSSAQTLAKIIQNTAVKNMSEDNETFVKAIHDVSRNMITITKKLASGNPTDDRHCSMHDDLLYCACHCKSTDYLFNGSKTWRKTPGKLDYYKLADVIVEMYDKGRDMVFNVSQHHVNSCESHDITSVDNHDINTLIKETIPETTTCSSLSNVVKAITSTIMTYATASEDVKFYLKMKGVSIDSEIKQLSNNVIIASINDNSITLRTQLGSNKELLLNNFHDYCMLRKEVGTVISQLIISAAIYEDTRDLIAKVVDINSIGNYVNSNINIAA